MLVRSILCIALASASSLAAEIALRATPIHVRPDSGSAVVKLVQSGERLPASITLGGTPTGWIAVTLPGPHDVFVRNSDISKNLDVKPGAPLRLDAKTDAAVLTHATSDDDMEITGLRGRWTQLTLNQDVTGYIFDSAGAVAETASPAVRQTPVEDVSMAPTSPPPTTRPQAGQAVDRTAEERQSLAALPRLFEGILTSTRAPLRPRRPYDFALQAEDGTRFAYLDLTKILLNTPVENFLNRNVVVYGVARPIPDTRDIVISVESAELRY
jgi:hypothetical protein